MTTKSDLLEHFRRDLRLNSDDIVFLHSGLRGWGKFDDGLGVITEAFSDLLTTGTLIIPTFSYSWCNGLAFDPRVTPPVGMGAYVNHAWTEAAFVRTPDPNFSVAVLRTQENASLVADLLAINQSCLGIGSIFDRIYNACVRGRRGHILLTGGAFRDVQFGATAIHYVEDKTGAPYRWRKRFFDPSGSGDSWEQNVRYLTEEEYREQHGDVAAPFPIPVVPSYGRMGAELIASGILKTVPFHLSASRVCGYRELCDFLEGKIKADPFYCLHPRDPE